MKLVAALWNRIDSCPIFVADTVVVSITFLLIGLAALPLGIYSEVSQLSVEDAQRSASGAEDSTVPACWPIALMTQPNRNAAFELGVNRAVPTGSRGV